MILLLIQLKTMLQVESFSGKILKKIKLVDEHKIYRDILHFINDKYEEETYKGHKIERICEKVLFDEKGKVIDINDKITTGVVVVGFKIEKHLTFIKYFNHSVDNLLESITHLTFGWYFNQPVENLPESITHLTFGYCFNKPVENLPESITHLTFGYCFNQPVGDLPESITHLILGGSFNQPVNKLPKSITHLTFGYKFNQPVDHLSKDITIVHNK